MKKTHHQRPSTQDGPGPLAPITLSLTAALLGLAVSGSAWADDAPPEGKAGTEATLPRITVKSKATKETATGPVNGYVAKRSLTATKTDTPLIETPQSVSVITRDQMDAQNVQSVSDSLRYSAGVITEANGPEPRGDMFQIRGFDASSFRDGLRDYTFDNQGGLSIEPYGLERVEVLRGPASVLFGQGGAGGIVQLVTKRPTAEPLHEVRLQVGSYDRKQAAFDFGGAVPGTQNGEWSYRLTGLVRDANTQVDHTKDNRTYLAPALTWRPSADTSLTLLTHYQKNKRGQGYQALPLVGTLVPGANGYLPTNRYVGEPGFERFDQERTSVGYALEHRLNDAWTVRQNLRWMEQETIYNSTYYAGYETDENGIGDGATITRYIGKGRERTRNAVVDNQVQWQSRSPGLEQTVLFGLDYQHMRKLQGTAFAFAPTLNIYNPVYGQDVGTSYDAPPDDTRSTVAQTGLYVQDQLKFNDRLVWTVGGRYDMTRTNAVDLTTDTGAPQSDRHFSWRTGLVYQLGDGWAPYLSYAESFLPVLGTTVTGALFKPETGNQYEAGVRYQPQGRDFSATASVYQLTRQNVTTADTANLGYQIQRGEVRSRGFELEVKSTIQPSLDLIATYTFNDIKVTRSNDGNEGMAPNGPAKHSASLWASWRVPALNALKVSAGARYVGTRYGDDLETVRLPSYTLFDAALEMDLGQLLRTSGDWRLALNASNLFDKTYVATCGYYRDGCKYGYRRSAAATLSYRW